jgi:hypothetical protein
MKRSLRLVRALLLVIGFTATAIAQMASIQGVVTDSSDANIAGADVTATNTGTGVEFKAQTNEAGFYLFPSLTPGSYTIRAVAGGFSQKTTGIIKLEVGQTARADFQLEVGAVNQSIEVSAAAALLDTQTSTVGQVVSNKQIVELPLNGRNYLALARLTAGTSAANGSRGASGGAFSAVGQNGSQTSILLDGVDVSSRLSGGILGNEAQIVTPSIDAVEEFKVVTNNNSAEFGFRMGGNVIVSTKSGSNQLHGSLYEFLRNEKFDAANFFAVGQPKPPYRQNQFGGTVGGRIIKNKTFFFGSYEGYRIRVGQSRISRVPTAAERNGNFASARMIYDWATTRAGANGTSVRDPFPGNIVPANRFDPVAKKAVDLYPLPNQGGVNNFFYSPTQINDNDQLDLRLDHYFSDQHRIFGRYSHRAADRVNPGPLPLPADGGAWATEDLTGHSIVVNLNSSLSPSINNEARFGYTKGDTIRDLPWTENLNQQIGITGIPDYGTYSQRGVARFQPTGYAQLGATTFWPNVNNLTLYQFYDNLLMVRGRHTIKTGFDFRREMLFRRAARFARGFFAFDGSFSQNPTNRGQTGDAMADFLLGTSTTSTIGNPNGETAVALNSAAYVQDDWRITNRLTLNLGVRWDKFGPPSFRNFTDTPVSNFAFDFASKTYRIERPADEGDCGCDQDWNNFAPRIGLAYQLTAKTVLRSGFGILYGQPDAISFFGDARYQNLPPEFTEITFPTDRLLSPSRIVSQGFPAGLIPATEVLENVFVNTAARFMPSQYSMQWFLDVQREMPKNFLLTLSYLGTGSHHMVQIRNMNQPLTPGPGTVKSRSPFPFFGWIVYRDPSGNANYNAFTSKLERRYSNGFTLIAAYTWSHAIDNVAEALTTAGGQELQDNYDMRRNRAKSVFDARHVTAVSAIYDLPFGKGRNWLNVGGPLDWILGGWQVGGIFSQASGRPFTATVSTDISNTGTSNPTGGTANQNHPDRLRDGNLPSGERSITRWFDVSAFAIPQLYTYGNAGRNILRGPGIRSLDLKLGKNFQIAERLRLEFRCEMFNATNTPSFALPASNVNLPTAGQITAAGPPRQIQFGLKALF